MTMYQGDTNKWPSSAVLALAARAHPATISVRAEDKVTLELEPLLTGGFQMVLLQGKTFRKSIQQNKITFFLQTWVFSPDNVLLFIYFEINQMLLRLLNPESCEHQS